MNSTAVRLSEDIVRAAAKDTSIGELKKGDLNGVRVYKLGEIGIQYQH